MFRRSYRAPCVRVLLKPRAWRRLPMKLLKWGRKMPSTKQYNLVPNDDYDTRIPVHPDEAFGYGITFQAKYIGTMDVPRPSSRVEIVAAMRRVRYEFKAKGVKKRKVTVDISTDGVRVTTRKKKSKSKSQKLFGRRSKSSGPEGVELMHHPIYRIFYVSHDSSDLKIFSYIARDGATNVFKCNVFKSNRKSQAMRIVRTVGQAFEVCHKMQSSGSEQPAASTSSALDEPLAAGAATDRASDLAPSKEAGSECAASESGATSTSKVPAAPLPAQEVGAVGGEEPPRPQHLELLPPPPKKDGRRSPRQTVPAPSISLPELPECITKVEITSVEDDAATPLSAQHQLQLLRERLEQQAQQTRAAVAQLLLLRDQLAAEQAARCEAQARTHQLLVHNKELLEHIAALVAHLQDSERGSARPISAHQLTLLPQMKLDTIPEAMLSEKYAACNGNKPASGSTASLIDIITHTTNATQNVENNNLRLSPSPFSASPNINSSPFNETGSTPSFQNMSNEQIQNYLITKFQNMGGFPNGTNEATGNNFSKNQQFYQNCNAFPSVPLLTNHYSSTEPAKLMNHQSYHDRGGSAEDLRTMNQPMSLGHSESSLCNNSQDTSKDSSPDAISSDESVPFIMPLSHKGTLTTTGEDGRLRLIVPVSPSGSSSDVGAAGAAGAAGVATLAVAPPPLLSVTPPGPITRSTSERVPNRSDLMAAMRSQWTRHTTK